MFSILISIPFFFLSRLGTSTEEVMQTTTILSCVPMSGMKETLTLFVSASGSFWSPKAAADCQTLSFSASFYKIHWGKNHPKST
jgi:hypothetical protein